MNIQNILWDVNDTLFDTHPAVTYAFSKVFNEMRRSVALNVIDEIVRLSAEDPVIVFSQRFKLEPDRLRAKYREAYRAILPVNQPPFPGVCKVCEFIHQNGGLNIAITHSDLDSVRRFLVVHNMSTLIDDIFSSSQGYPNKPNPAIVLAALAKHSLIATETLLIGNSERDILAGQTAGIRTCLFGQAELTTSADIQVTDYHRLMEILSEEKNNS